MVIRFYTFPAGHIVSDGEFSSLQKGFAKAGMELVRKEDEREADLYMVKGFSHSWDDVPHDKPVVFYSIGTDNNDNSAIIDLYKNSNAVVSISNYCKEQIEECFGERENHYVIYPAREPNLPKNYPKLDEKLKLATTCIPRPVKRVEDVERLCSDYDIEIVTAYGSVSDFSYYWNCHGYIHLSRKEGMPNTVLEALAYGLPCIVTNHGGAKEAIGDAGIVIKNDPDFPKWQGDIEPVDDYLFEEAIEKFKKELPYLRNRVRERVLTELNDKITAEKFKKIYENCLLFH